MELLLQQPGLDVNLTCHVYRRTALHMACGQGHAGIVKRLLAHPSLTCHNAAESEGFSPLMLAVGMNRVQCVRELVVVEGVDLETRDLKGVGLEETARIRGYGLEAWQVVRQEIGRREEGNRTLSIDKMMAKCRGVLEKHSKKKKMIWKKAKANEAREKRTRADEAQRANMECVLKNKTKEAEEKVRLDEAVKVLETKSLQSKEEMQIEFGKLEALMEEDSSQDRSEEVECPVCCEEMAPPRTIIQCS